MYANPPDTAPNLPQPDPDLDRCPHGRTAGQTCPHCDGQEDDPGPSDVISRLPVNPKALSINGLLFRCQVCGCLVVDMDWCLHQEHHTAA